VTETAALPPGAFRVQFAAVRSEDGARATWSELQAKLPELSGLQLFIERIDLGGDLGVFYRVQGGPLPDQSAAYDLCAAVAVRGQDCLVVKP
jgi:cell division septation protein DedD